MKNKVLLILLSGIVLSLSTSAIGATDCFIREDILPADKYDFGTDSLVKKQPIHEEIQENTCPINSNEKCTTTKDTFLPCEELQRSPQEILKQTANDDKINVTLAYFDNLDKTLNLTDEQKVKSDEIKQNMVSKIVDNKRIIESKKGEMIALQSEKNQAGVERKCKYIENYIKQLEKNIENTQKQSKKEYFKILSAEQKQAYKALEKDNTAQ